MKHWDPITVIEARDPGGDFGMIATHYRTGGRMHWYHYRNALPTTGAIEFRNRLYNGFGLVFSDESMHLSFKRNDRAAVRDWRHFQAIKNQVAGPDREAIEIFPPEDNLIDGANEYHLWVLPPGQRAPFGFANHAVLDGTEEHLQGVPTHDHAQYRQTGISGAKQRQWEPGIPTGKGLGS